MLTLDESMSESDIGEMISEANTGDSGGVTFDDFVAILRFFVLTLKTVLIVASSTTMTLSSMAGRYIASNQIGRCLSPKVTHTNRVKVWTLCLFMSTWDKRFNIYFFSETAGPGRYSTV